MWSAIGLFWTLISEKEREKRTEATACKTGEDQLL